MTTQTIEERVAAANERWAPFDVKLVHHIADLRNDMLVDATGYAHWNVPACPVIQMVCPRRVLIFLVKALTLLGTPEGAIIADFVCDNRLSWSGLSVSLRRAWFDDVYPPVSGPNDIEVTEFSGAGAVKIMLDVLTAATLDLAPLAA